jgi:glycosyltransferase involved in cell wall biosynthesis
LLKRLQDVEILGYSDLSTIFSSCSVLLNSSRHDSFGVAILEAMAAGVIPVITENCGAKELLVKADRKLIRAVDAKDLAEGVIGVFKRKDKVGLSKKLRKISAQYTKEKSCKQFKQVFERLVYG